MPVPDRFGVRRYRQEGSRLILDSHGVDSSGRPLYLSNDTKSRLDQIFDDIGWLPTITQGEYMLRAGGGADDSSGFHNFRCCDDFRIWDHTDSEMDEFINAASKVGLQGWRRDAAHGGMDPHCHAVACGPHEDASSGAIAQMASVARGGDGLSPEGSDYERKYRKLPLVLDYDYVKEEQGDMGLSAEDWERLNKIEDRNTDKVLAALNVQSKGTRLQIKELRAEMRALGADIDKSPAEVREAVRTLFGPRLRAIDEKLSAVVPPEPEE